MRTRIRLPDETHALAKSLCEAREIPLTELVRPGIENSLSEYAPDLDANREWHPPKPRRLGWKGLTDEEIKVEALRTAVEVL